MRIILFGVLVGLILFGVLLLYGFAQSDVRSSQSQKIPSGIKNNPHW